MREKRTRHNYELRLEQVMDLLPRGSVMRAAVWHDLDCAIFDGGLCNCEPDIRFTAIYPKGLPTQDRRDCARARGTEVLH